MLQVHSYAGVCDKLRERFKSTEPGRGVRITGLIFGIPGTPIGQSDYLPVIDYWHYRSDLITDFFCGGFFETGAQTPPPRDSYEVPEIHHASWSFSSQLLNDFENDIEKRSSWKPSGGMDVILCTARYFARKDTTTLDFTSAVCMNLQDAKKVEAIRDLSHLLNMVFEFAKEINEDTTDAAWDFSDARGFFVLKRSLRKMLESWFPKWLKQFGHQAEMFAVHDISPRTTA